MSQESADRSTVDWLEDNGDSLREEQHAKAIEFAQNLYSVFETDSRAKALLAHWTMTIEQRDIPPSASHAEFAYYESRRVFVRDIHRQIALSHAK